MNVETTSSILNANLSKLILLVHCTKRTAISGSGFHSSNEVNFFSPKNSRNSFIEHTPHERACWIPITSMILSTSGVPWPKAHAGLSVAS